MLRVVVVDDEKIVRITLSTIIKWQENGFQLVGTFADGLQVLEGLEKSQPDIVITDLMMPNMDGLELIRTLHKQNFTGKIIVLSNYGDYEYVREAMKLGAVDYLLKVTFKPDELLALLIKVSEQLSEERKQQEKKMYMQIELNDKQLQQRNQVWKDLFQEDEPYMIDVLKEADKLGITSEKLAGHLITVKIDKYEEVLFNGKIKNKRLLNFSVANIIKETLSDRCTIELVEIGSGQYVIIAQEQDRRHDDAGWSQIASSLIQMLNLYLNLTVSIAISELFIGLEQLRKQYALCMRAVLGTFYSGPGSVFFTRGMHAHTSVLPTKYTEWSNDLKKAVEEYDLPRVSATLAELVAQAKQEMCDPALLKQSMLMLLNDLESMVVKWKEIMSPTEDEAEVRILPALVKQQIMQAGSIEDYYIFVDRALQEVSLLLQQARSRKCRREVLRIIEIMQERIDSKITLDILAGEVNMTVSYLCRVFRQDTGKSIVQYMNELKINQSIELLKQPDARIKEVAAAIGIDDPFYFNRLFRKTIGLSPTDFRKKLFPNKM